MARLKKHYEEAVKHQLMERFGYMNPMQVPKLVKIVISMGVAKALQDKNAIQTSAKELSLISGQKPVVRKSKKSIANFKLREGQEIGLMVTLRRRKMYDFMERFIHIICPAMLDFRGLRKKGDGRGSYSVGLPDQQAFPELHLDEVKREQGMNITFVTSAREEEEGLALLALLGMPFKRESN